MKRDPDLIRKLLVFFEDKSDCNRVEVGTIHIEGFDTILIQYHLDLMYEAGFLSGEPMRSSTSDRLIGVLPFRLTWKGHEFLDAARSNTIWNQAKEILGNKSLTLSFEALYQLLTKLASEALQLRESSV